MASTYETFSIRGKYRFVIDLNDLDREIDALARELGVSSLNTDRFATVTKGISKVTGKKGFTLRVDGAMTVAKNLRNFAAGTDREIRVAFMELARQILEDAVIHAPMESGQLRESGRASVGGRLVAKGTTSGISTVPLSKVGWSSDTLSVRVSFGVEHDRVNTEIPRVRSHYRDKKGVVHPLEKETPNDFMVPVWTHENLDSNVEWHPDSAGPKYLENALKKYSSFLKPRVGAALMKAVKGIQGR